MTIKSYELKNGEKRYMFQVYVGVNPLTGKDQRTTRRGFKTKKEAQLALSRIQLEIDRGTFGTKSLETYQDVYNDWIKEYEKSVEESTFVKVKSFFKHQIIPAFGKYRIEKIDIKTCKRHLENWKEKFKDYNSLRSYASMVLDHAVEEKIIERNVMKDVKVSKRKSNDDKNEPVEENFYDRDELIKFLSLVEKNMSYKVYALFRLLAFTGMRKGEALALTWNDINFKDNTLHINKAISRGVDGRLYVKSTKTGEARTITMDALTMSILEHWRTKQKQDYLKLGYNTLQPKQLVFNNRNNTFINPTLTNTWIKRLQTKHNLKEISTHGLRHTHCSLLFEAGATLKEVQERLGHTNIKTTMNIYTHVTQKAKEETAEKFARYMDF